MAYVTGLPNKTFIEPILLTPKQQITLVNIICILR